MAANMSKRIFELLDKDSALTAKVIAERLGCPLGTASSTIHRWKQKQKLSQQGAPGFDTDLPTEAEIAEAEAKALADEPKVQEQYTAVNLAAELLKQVVRAIDDYGKMLGERNYWRTEALNAGEKLKKAEEERDRIKQIHNTMVTMQNNGKIPSLEEVVKVLRRSQMQSVRTK